MKKTARGLVVGALSIGCAFILQSAVTNIHARPGWYKSEATANTQPVNRKRTGLSPTPKAVMVLGKDQERTDNNESKGENRLLSQVPVSCDSAASYLDHAVIDTGGLPGAYLIIISRLGTGEKSNRLSQLRLSNVQEYLLRRGSDLKYVLAQGPSVKGLGRIEAYVGGRLLYIMPYEKNAKGHCLPGREGW